MDDEGSEKDQGCQRTSPTPTPGEGCHDDENYHYGDDMASVVMSLWH